MRVAATQRIALAIIAVIGLFAGAVVLLDYHAGLSVSGREEVAAVPSIPSDDLAPSAQSGMVRAYAGYTNLPGGAFSYSFLQADGLRFDAPWSTVRGADVHITMPGPLTDWTSPGPCASGVQECGHLAVAIPADGGPPGRPEAWILNAGVEMPIDASSWHRQHGELRLNGRQYFVVLTNAADIAAGSTLTLGWLPWDGTFGPPALPVQ